MREPAVSKVIKDALVTASWIQEVLAQRRTLLRWSSPQTCPGPWDEQRGLASRLQAKQVRRDLNERLSRTEGAERRAAVICLARSTKDRYTEELDLALSGSSGWTVTEVAALLTVLKGFEPRYGDDTWLSRVLDLAQDFDPQERETLRKPIEPLVRAIYDSPIEAARRRRLERLIARVLRTDPAPIPRSTLSLSDRWATTVCDHLDRTPHLLPLIDHLGELRGPRPTKAWRVRCGELLRTADARQLVWLALRAFDRDTEQIRRWGSTWRLVVSERNVDTARGFLWAAVLLGDDHAQADVHGHGGGDEGAGRREVVQALVALAVRTSGVEPRMVLELRLAGAAINALGEIDDPDAMAALWRLQSEIRHRALRKQVATALAASAGRQGISPGQLLERSVPDHGLAANGTATRRIGDWTATLAIENAATVRLSFTGPDGETVRTTPSALKDSADLKALKTLRNEVRKTLAAERARLEGLFSTDREWPYDEWARYYRDHPITGVLTRSLIWQTGQDGWTAFLCDEPHPGRDDAAASGGYAAAPEGEAAEVGGGEAEVSGGGESDVCGGMVRLWHPGRVSLAELTAWREVVAGRGVRQPFKQAFREVYLLTPAEGRTGLYSNRFAAHIVEHRRLYALLKERGWQTNWLGAFQKGFDAEATKELAEGAWRIEFRYETAVVDGYEVTLAATDQVRFDRRAGRGWRRVALAEVPPLVFSEGMRDVDLFVAITSIAADPGWSDRGEERHRDYWRDMSSAPLPPSGEVRRDALARVLPRTAIADRCTLTDRFLIVRGDLRTYKIHLGSANILMEPGGVYLCIVPSRRGDTKVFLPFEEDGRLALILSKAFLLARDIRIKDKSILKQIHG